MKFKKVAALVLASAMTLGLAACGNGNSSTPSQSSGGASSSGTTSSSATEISLWSFNIGGFTEASNWDSLIAAFNEANPDIKVTVTPINYQDGDQKLTSAITSGSGPDIIFEGPERIVGNYAREGLMVDLGDVWGDASADIGENISSVCQLDGTYYMYPLSAAAHCMAINLDAFKAAGAAQYIDLETRTWSTDNFIKAVEALYAEFGSTVGAVYCGGQGGDQGGAAGAVVQVFGEHPAILKIGWGVIDRHIPQLDQFQCLLPAGCADVNVEVIQFDRLLLFFILGQGDHAPHSVLKHHALAADVPVRQPAQAAEAEVSLLFNVGDHQADAVHMGREHQLFPRPLLVDNQIPHGIHPILVHIGGDLLGDHLPHPILTAGGAKGAGQLRQTFK